MLVEVLRKLEVQGEPQAMLTVWTDNNGCVNVKSNCAHTHTIGMGVYAAAFALVRLLQNPEETTKPPKTKPN